MNPTAIIKTWDELDAFSLPELHPSTNEAKKMDHGKSHWSSCSVDLPDPYSSEKLAAVLDQIPDSILRVKGCTKLDQDEHYSYFEKVPSGETFVRPFSGNLVTGFQNF